MGANQSHKRDDRTEFQVGKITYAKVQRCDNNMEWRGQKCDWKGIIKGKEETNNRVVCPKPRDLFMQEKLFETLWGQQWHDWGDHLRERRGWGDEKENRK